MGISKKHLQGNGSSQYLRQRSGYGGQHRAAQNGTGYPLGTILRGCFTQAQSRHNAQGATLCCNTMSIIVDKVITHNNA